MIQPNDAQGSTFDVQNDLLRADVRGYTHGRLPVHRLHEHAAMAEDPDAAGRHTDIEGSGNEKGSLVVPAYQCARNTLSRKAVEAVRPGLEPLPSESVS